MTIKNISHITLICKDIEKTGRFFEKIFDAKERYSTSKEKFFKIGDIWFVAIKGESVDKTYNHIAFEASDKNFDEIKKELQELGLEILEGRKRAKEEGGSLYFYDYDNHLFELHRGDLEKRIEHFKSQ